MMRSFGSHVTRPAKGTIKHQQGVAILLAMVVVALATALVSGLLWQQFAMSRLVANQAEREQAHQFLSGAREWAKLVLQDTPHPAYDTLNDPWAQPLARTPLDQLADDLPMLEGATIEGQIEDAQGRFNLRNLVDAGGQINPSSLAALQKLCAILGLPTGYASMIAQQLAQAYTSVPFSGNPSQGLGTQPGSTILAPGAVVPLNSGTRPVPPVLPEDLQGMPGLDQASAQVLAAYVVLLDQPGTTVNFNTATPQVMAAVLPDLSLPDAVNLASERDRAYFTGLGDIANRLHGRAGHSGLAGISTTTAYFIIKGSVSLGRTRASQRSLVHRGAFGGNNRFAILWQQEI
jgi:general secretion pathway protein K